jgi:hypothetical protein
MQGWRHPYHLGGLPSRINAATRVYNGPDGHWSLSAKAEGSLTARLTRRAET